LVRMGNGMARLLEKAEWITARPISEQPATIRPCLWIKWGVAHGPGGPLFAADALAMPGDHNRQNLLMATAVALQAGLDAAMIEAGLRSFPGVLHRLERIRERQGISWHNNSKATNYDAAEVALKAPEGPLVVLAGGQAKQGDATGWIRQLQRQAKAVVLYGNARDELATLLADGGYRGEVHNCEGLAEAVPLADTLAELGGCRGVLLSPACASFDQYRDFEARGDHFRELVLSLPA